MTGKHVNRKLQTIFVDCGLFETLILNGCYSNEAADVQIMSKIVSFIRIDKFIASVK